MRMHIDALFTHDARGRMLRVNEPMGKTAPRFFLGRTTQGNECGSVMISMTIWWRNWKRSACANQTATRF